MPNYAWDAIVQHVARLVSQAGEIEVPSEELVSPPDPKLGDLSYGCFKIAKQRGKNPAELAKELAAKIAGGEGIVASASAAGPYLNVTLRASDVVSRLTRDVELMGERYGTLADGTPRQLVFEYAQPNTHKEIHVGHLRNLVLGSSLVRVLQKSGWDVVAASYHGDVGAHVAKCLWLFVKKGMEALPQKAKKKSDGLTTELVAAILKAVPKADHTGKYLGSLYAEASRELETHPELKDDVSVVQQKLEARDAAWMALWQETRRWSLEEMKEIFTDLGVHIDRQYLESEVVGRGQQIVDELLQKNVAKESQGAIVVDLEDEKLGVFLVRKSDGTSLYATKDLALAELKAKEYPNVARSLVLVDNRQMLYFKQLFATLKRMGFEKPMEFVGYEFLTLKSGAMSSREGNVVTWQGFREEVIALATKETQQRHPEWNEGKVTHTAWCLMMGGVKFGMLKQDSDKIITFDLEKALSFDGDTGPYIQYAATRLGSILRKAGWTAEKNGDAGDLSVLTEDAEKKLAMQVARLPGVVGRSARELRPAILAQWCLDMATRANEFYRDVKVLDADFGVKQARLRLVASARMALTVGLDMLGIPVPEEM